MSGHKHHLTINAPYREADPLEIEDARKASHRVAQIRRDAEGTLRELIEDAVAKEGEYRKALAKKMVELRGTCSATEAKERARGEAPVTERMMEFRIAEGMVDAQKERLRGLEGERSQLKSLIDYSAKVAAVLGEQSDRPGLKAAA